MAQFVPDAVIDLLLEGIATSTLLSVCSGASTPTAGTLAGVTLASVALTAGSSNEDYSIGDGASGRMLTVAQQSNILITGSTTDATHVVFSLGGVIMDVTTCTTQELTNGGTVTVPEWTHTVADPA